jgi:hypothetical protein
MKSLQLFRIRFVALLMIAVLAAAWPWSAGAQRDVDFNPNSAIEESWCIVGCKKLSGSEGIG